MLVHKLEYRFCMARTANALAIFHDGHHRDPGALARWSAMISSRLVLKSHELTKQMVKASRTKAVVSSRLEKKCGLMKKDTASQDCHA